MEEKITVTIRRAAEMTSLSTKTIARMVSRGDLRSTKIGKRRLIFVDSLYAALGADSSGKD